MEGTEGYERGTKAIGTRSAYEYLQLQMEARRAQARGVQFDPFDSNVARLKQQQLCVKAVQFWKPRNSFLRTYSSR